MAYKKKYECYRCGGKGKGAIEMFMGEYEKLHRSWANDRICSVCRGDGYNLYDLNPRGYKEEFVGVDWSGLEVEYEDFVARYKCQCGGELFFGDEMLVCDCGRVYRLSVVLSVNETHLGDMEYWEDYKDEL